MTARQRTTSLSLMETNQKRARDVAGWARCRRKRHTCAPSLAAVSVCVFLAALAPVRAVDYPVANVAQFNAAIPLVQAGGTITLSSGTWSNAAPLFNGNGTAGRPTAARSP